MRQHLIHSSPIKDVGNILHHSLSFTQGNHLCHFYQDERMLMENLANFVVPGLNRGDGVVIIATKKNAESFKNFLTRRKVDVADAISREQLLLLDAHATLSMFIVNGKPDRNLFKATVPPVIRGMLKKFPKVRAYGEMVNVLFNEQNFEATNELENLWNELAKVEPFSLMCGYSICDKQHSHQLEAICERHTHLISNFEHFYPTLTLRHDFQKS